MRIERVEMAGADGDAELPAGFGVNGWVVEELYEACLIKDADTLTFTEFLAAYEDLVDRARANALTTGDSVGATRTPSVYSPDVAKTIQAPILRVNGDDPEAVVRAGQLAFASRQEFGRDVVIALICYLRRGHNEADDPSMTQPQMCTLIENERSVRELYTEALAGRGDIATDEDEPAHREYGEQHEVLGVLEERRDAHAPRGHRLLSPPGRRGLPRSRPRARVADVHGHASQQSPSLTCMSCSSFVA